jgi:hypothetical protein
MINDDKQLELALGQLESFKGLREAMRLHLDDTQPTLTATVVESYDHRIHELQEEICEYLLRQRESELRSPPHEASAPVGRGSAAAKP